MVLLLNISHQEIEAAVRHCINTLGALAMGEVRQELNERMEEEDE